MALRTRVTSLMAFITRRLGGLSGTDSRNNTAGSSGIVPLCGHLDPSQQVVPAEPIVECTILRPQSLDYSQTRPVIERAGLLPVDAGLKCLGASSPRVVHPLSASTK